MRLSNATFHPWPDVFDRLFFSPFAYEAPRAEWPELYLTDQGETFALTADLPGVLAKDLEITTQGKELFVKGSRKLPVPEGYQLRRQERTDFRFSRRLELPTAIDADGVNAKLENGVLTLTIPKAKESRPRTIAVKVGAQ